MSNKLRALSSYEIRMLKRMHKENGRLSIENEKYVFTFGKKVVPTSYSMFCRLYNHNAIQTTGMYCSTATWQISPEGINLIQ